VKSGRHGKKGVGSTRAGAQERAKTSRPKVPPRPKAKEAAASSKKSAKTTLSRARATTPARSTHPHPYAHALAVPKPRREPMPSPMPTRHVAPPRPAVVMPARSMPPVREGLRKLVAAPSARAPIVLPDFTEAGVLLAITYSIRDGRRGEFFDLMRDLKPLLSVIGGADCTVYEDRSRANYFMEVFRFKDESEFTAFDDKFHKDRKIAAIYALLDDIVEAEKSDFKIFERRL
jgi:hypothetical protein